jgi:hypothetical protein
MQLCRAQGGHRWVFIPIGALTLQARVQNAALDRLQSN